MRVTENLFRKGMRRLGGAVTIVTAADGKGRWAGLTATAVTSLSAEPPRLLACINRQGGTYDIISRGRTLCINVLGASHLELAKRFAGMSGEPECDRFEQGLWASLVTGAPALKGALATFDCTVDNILDVGSHGIVIGQVQGIEAEGEQFEDPLAYIDGTWSTLTPL
ncbi:flavin reductase family protein [Pseudokordiimonas caeni]|uniref:flavin reductase family protein n=1 Tax=Pseudokordiimonas caeni TaxID=2997908 RepID=UPI002810FA43|nr:flavin reductase family protein [Pseudokordiimonas caeni]